MYSIIAFLLDSIGRDLLDNFAALVDLLVEGSLVAYTLVVVLELALVLFVVDMGFVVGYTLVMVRVARFDFVAVEYNVHHFGALAAV
jgi:hypothetical protein